MVIAMTNEQRAELEQKYLLALLTRDAKIWNRHAPGHLQVQTHDDIEEAKPKAKRQRKTFLSDIPCNKCGGHRRYGGGRFGVCVKCSTEKAKRVDDIKREAQKRIAPPLPRGRGLGIRPSQQLSDRAVNPPGGFSQSRSPCPFNDSRDGDRGSHSLRRCATL